MPRYKALNGRVLWLTGLSGAGKSTIAEKIQHHLLQRNITPLILDGDLVRAAVDDPHWEFDNKSRLSGSFRYSRLASLAASQGLTVIVPTISMFHDVHKWNRQNIENYFEVYLRTKEKTRRLRDPKVLYAQQQTTEKSDMVGIGHVLQAPLKPDMLIDNNTKFDEQAISDLALTITDRFLYDTTR